MNQTDILEIVNNGGLLAFAYVVWRGQEKIAATLATLSEALVRHDARHTGDVPRAPAGRPNITAIKGGE